MSAVLMDVWAELQQKRLVPVAAAMLAALVALPFLLIKPAEQPAPPTSVPTASSGAKPLDSIDSKALARTADQEVSDGSALDAFLTKNPFKPVQDLGEEAALAGAGGDPFGGPQASASQGEAAVGSDGAGGAVGGGTSGGDTGGGVGGGGTTQPSQPDSGGESQKYTYVLDLTLIRGEESKHYNSFERLGMLPSESKPLLVFLGVTASGNEASFLVDATVTTSGEGRCKPSPTECGFVYLEPGEQQQFSDPDGGAYTLQIDQIRKVSVEAAASAAAARLRKERVARRSTPVARTAEGPAPGPRRLTLPFLSDFEIEFGGQR
jgi:hypothetical protein